MLLLAATLAAAASAEPVPGDAELEAAGARIGTISIRTIQIFDQNDPAENFWLYRVVNALHRRTRESAIRSQLLFRSGERYSRAVLDETERNMRANADFLREPSIQPIRYHDGVVDLEVVTHDVWTFDPGIDFSRTGGSNSTNFDLTDENFLGLGKYAEVGHLRNIDRSSSYALWQDPNVWGTRWRDNLQYYNNSDGKLWSVTSDHPFYALETRYAAGATIGDNRGVVTRYAYGQAFDAYELDARLTDAYAGMAVLISRDWTVRASAGWRHDESSFNAAAGQVLLGPLPADRNLSYPYARVEWLENDYSTLTNLDQIGFTEDIHYGLDANVGLGYSTPALGSDRRALLADAELSHGWHFTRGQYVFLDAALSGRLSAGMLQDFIGTGSASYYLTTSERTKFFARLTGTVGHALDLDHDIWLGGDTGLRGYPLRYDNGTGRALLTLEERLYTPWFPLRLVHVGGAVYVDVGRTWGTPAVPTPGLGTLKDVGAGLRLGNARSSFGSVIHVDLAVPLDAAAHISRVQFLVSTEKTF